MQDIFEAFTDVSLMIDVAISLSGLGFMSMLIYAMRWLPGIVRFQQEEASAGDDAVVTVTPNTVEGYIIVDADMLSGIEKAKNATADIL